MRDATSVSREDGPVGPFVVTLTGDLDLASREATTARLAEAVAAAHTNGNDVVVDLSAVTFLDSTGISCLVRAYADVGPERSFHLSGPSPMTRRVLEVVGLTTMICDDPLIDSLEVD
jgi:anti-sigma B factor antagonist